MDLYCTKCGEPWALDCLHETEEYQIERDRNTIVSCGCCEVNLAARPRPAIAIAAAALHDLMPDDPDGVAAMLEDADMLGLL